ncbi:MAG: hypothetical protein KDH08_21295, partial [Anaerolineae bacterium]|nr:hypothetical protein [Anaerolineae bacterium]MCB0241103.1 hypothetical protein [Anaerolineae bacterium]
ADGGSVMRATGKLADESWWQVCCVDGREAWVSGDWVQPVGPSTALGDLPVVAAPSGTKPAALFDRLE